MDRLARFGEPFTELADAGTDHRNLVREIAELADTLAERLESGTELDAAADGRWRSATAALSRRRTGGLFLRPP